MSYPIKDSNCIILQSIGVFYIYQNFFHFRNRFFYLFLFNRRHKVAPIKLISFYSRALLGGTRPPLQNQSFYFSRLTGGTRSPLQNACRFILALYWSAQPSISSCSSEAFTGNLGMRPADEIKDFGLGLQGPPLLVFLLIYYKSVGVIYSFLGVVDADAFGSFNRDFPVVV